MNTASNTILSGGVPGEPSAQWLARISRGRFSIVVQSLLAAAIIIAFNQIFDLKDRDIYRYYYNSLDNCQWVGCFLISDSVRSPTFLSLIIAGHRLGLEFDTTFTLMSLLSLVLLAQAMRSMPDPFASTRFALIAISLGSWLFIIQVKLFLAFSLYLYSHTRSHRWLRMLLALAAILTHESIVVFILLEFLWRPSDFRVSLRAALVFGVLVAVLVTYLGATSNVFLSTIQKIEQYNANAAAGDVPVMSRLSMFSVIFLLFGLVGLLRFRLSPEGTVSARELKILLWMFMPWLVFLIFADNGVFATRLSELALLHTLLVMPVASGYHMPSRAALLVFALAFGSWTFIVDILFG